MIVAAVAAFSAGCVSSTDAPTVSRSSWRVDCSTDQVTAERRCFAGTFGTPQAPFQVYYNGSRGPFVMAGFNTFPGRNALVRFDSDSTPFTVPDDAGVSAIRPAPQIVQRMMTASTAHVRYNSWPNGGRTMTVDVTGFPEAWSRLQEMRR